MKIELRGLKKPVVIFDFDGTIADTFSPTLKILSRDLQRYNKVDERYNVRQLRMMSIKEIVTKIPGAWWRGPWLIYKAKRRLAKMMDKLVPLPGMAYTLRSLYDQGYDLLIVTSNNERNVRVFLKKYDLEGIFSAVVETRGLFNKARRLEEVVRKMEVAKEEVIYVGDEIRDVVACKEVGVKVAAVTQGFNSREGLERWEPDYLVGRPWQLLTIVGQAR
jgi:phosphoglycolate phosphatase-like HAD superfamily hydrolase